MNQESKELTEIFGFTIVLIVVTGVVIYGLLAAVKLWGGRL